MFKWCNYGVRAGLIGWLVLAQAGCNMSGGGGAGGNDNTSGNDNTGGNDNSGGGATGNIQSLQVMLTNAQVGGTGEFLPGDDVIAIGTGQESGVQYLVPSRGDVDPISISNFEEFVTSGFGVTGNWIMCRTFDGEVVAFNAETEELTMFTEAELAVAGGAGRPNLGEFWGDGDYFLTVADASRVADGRPVKVVDVSSGTPVVTSYMDPGVTPTPTRENETWIGAIDAEARQFVLQITDFLAVYDLDTPNAMPTVINLTNEGGASNFQTIKLDDGLAIYLGSELSGNNRFITYMTNVNTGVTMQLSENPSRSRNLSLESGVFGYFAHVTDADVSTNDTARGVFGEITGNGPEITVTHDARQAIGADPEDGIVGYGCSMAITPDGRYRFIAGCGSVGAAEYLQVSTGGIAEVLNEQQDLDPANMGTPAADVKASNTLVVFRTTGPIAYIELP